MPFPNSSKAFASSSCELPDITRDWLHDTAWKLRYRTAFGDDGLGVHPSVTSFTMHEEAHAEAGKLVRDLHALGQEYGYAGVPRAYQWTGLAGTKVCKPGYHRYGAALDFTRFDWGPDCFVDTAVHGKARRYLRRRYLAAISVCRKHFGTVLHLHHDPDGSHWNHIHADLGRSAGAADWDYQTDTTIIQWAARDLAGVTDLVIDGDFGPETEQGLKVLREAFKTEDVDPAASPANFKLWLDLIARHGMADQDAGAFRADTRAKAAAGRDD